MPHKLETADKIIRFLEGISYCVDKVTITYVNGLHFSFKVEVPRWYKIIFSKYLRNKIQKELKERLYAGVTFDFEIYSTAFF